MGTLGELLFSGFNTISNRLLVIKLLLCLYYVKYDGTMQYNLIKLQD